LAEHTANMMRFAKPICEEAQVNKDLVIAGVLFHDSGKMFEHLPEEESTFPEHNIQGELTGHISAGILLLQKCLRAAIEKFEGRDEERMQIASTHLTHLVISHHGKVDWGSPIPPKTKEAYILHTVDMLDAHLEMFDQAMQAAPETITPDGSYIFPRRSPLPKLVSSLEIWDDPKKSLA
jgi:3'-5' exoribonuclease